MAADLTVEIEDARAEVRSTGERLFVEFSTLPEALRALRGLPEDGSDRLADLLRTTDLTVEVRVRDRTVAVVGARASPGVVSRGLGVDPVEVRVGGLLGAVGRELAVALRTLDRALR